MVSLKGRTCEVCGTTYRATYSKQRTCGRACGFIITGRASTAPPRPPRTAPTCRTCGVTGTLADTWTAWCSEQCKTDEINVRVTGLYQLAVSLGLGGSGWRARLVEHIAQRDGTTCAMCTQPVNLDLPAGPKGDELGPSLDHVTPRTKGGTDTVDNLRLTHWRCNRDRSNRAA